MSESEKFTPPDGDPAKCPHLEAKKNLVDRLGRIATIISFVSSDIALLMLQPSQHPLDTVCGPRCIVRKECEEALAAKN
jgi:hypothetical protein